MGTPVNCQVLETELFSRETEPVSRRNCPVWARLFYSKTLRTEIWTEKVCVAVYRVVHIGVPRQHSRWLRPPTARTRRGPRTGGWSGLMAAGWPGSVGGRGDRRDGPLRGAAAGALGGRSLCSLCLRWPRLRPSLVCCVRLNGIKLFDRSPSSGFAVSGNVSLAGWVGRCNEPVDAAARLFDTDELGSLDDAVNGPLRRRTVVVGLDTGHVRLRTL